MAGENAIRRTLENIFHDLPQSEPSDSGLQHNTRSATLDPQLLDAKDTGLWVSKEVPVAPRETHFMDSNR